MGARSQTSILDLKNDKSQVQNGKLVIRCEKLTDSNGKHIATKNFWVWNGELRSSLTQTLSSIFGTKATLTSNSSKSAMITLTSKFNAQKSSKTTLVPLGDLLRCKLQSSSIRINSLLSNFRIIKNLNLGLRRRRQRPIHRRGLHHSSTASKQCPYNSFKSKQKEPWSFNSVSFPTR